MKDDKLILDSSAIAALFFKEEHSQKVEEIVEKSSQIYTVSQAYSEVANAAWKRVIIYGEDNELVREAVGRATDFITNVCKVEQMKNILTPAFELALENEITVYDALFIKLAIDLDGVVVTTDRKLSNKVNESICKFVDCVN